MRRAWHELWRLLRYGDPRGAQTCLAIWSVFWGVWLLMPWDTFGVSVVYRILAQVASEYVWGIAFLVIGLWHLRVALVGSLTARRLTSYVSVIKWGFLTMLYTIGGLHTQATVTYTMLSLISLWIFIRMGMAQDEPPK